MEPDTNTRDIRVRNDRPSLWFYFPFIIAAVIIGIVFVTMREKGYHAQDLLQNGDTGSGLSEMNAARREIMLYFPRSDSDWVSETFEIKGSESIRQEIRQCLELLLKGSIKNSIILFNSTLEVEELYIDSSGNLIIDFQTGDQSVVNMGGVQREWLAVQSILRTISVNFPSLQTVRFLFNHKESASFAGHVAIDKTFDLRPAGVPAMSSSDQPQEETPDENQPT